MSVSWSWHHPPHRAGDWETWHGMASGWLASTGPSSMNGMQTHYKCSSNWHLKDIGRAVLLWNAHGCEAGERSEGGRDGTLQLIGREVSEGQ